MTYPVILTCQAEGDVLRERERQQDVEGWTTYHPERRPAFIGSETSYADFRASIESHIALDNLRQHHGYWSDGKGCAVGCTLHDFVEPGQESNHSLYWPKFHIPPQIAGLEDGIFERLPKALADQWPLRFADAVKPGMDLSLVWPRFAVWMLVEDDESVLSKAAHDDTRDFIRAVAAFYRGQIDALPDAEMAALEKTARDAWDAWAARDAWTALADWAHWAAWTARAARATKSANKLIALIQAAPMYEEAA